VKKQGPFKLFLFNLALHYKQFWMKLGFSTTAASPLCNKIFFSKTQVSLSTIDVRCAAEAVQLKRQGWVLHALMVSLMQSVVVRLWHWHTQICTVVVLQLAVRMCEL
jgi:hypothetical protein